MCSRHKMFHTAIHFLADHPAGYEVQSPKIANCEPWPLTELLDHEKEVTGMFMSGHPLDHFKFEMNHYGIITLAEFNEVKEAVSLQANPGKIFPTGRTGG